MLQQPDTEICKCCGNVSASKGISEKRRIFAPDKQLKTK
jgi:hypothetical protein